MSEYLFPVLPIEELVELMPFLTEADFKKPEAARWHKIYCMIFECLTSEKVDNGNERALILFPKYCKSENPEFYEDASCILWFTLALQQLLQQCGFKDFTFKDMRDPRPKRCIMLCSAVVNFMRFKVNREPVVNSIIENVERIKLQYEKLEKTNTDLKNSLSIAQERYEERQKKKQELEEESKGISENLISLQTEIESCRNRIIQKKTLISEARAQRAKLKCEIDKVGQEMEKLQRNIVQSPHKLKDKLSSLQEKVENQRKTKAEKLELVTSRRKRLDELKSRREIVEQGIHFMESMVEVLESKKSVEIGTKSIKEKRQVNVHKMKEHRIKEEELVESISLINDRIKKLQLNKKARTGDLDACFSQATQKKKKSALKVETLKNEKDRLKREKEMYASKVESIRFKCNEESDQMLQKYMNVLEKLNQYHLFLNEKLAAAS